MFKVEPEGTSALAAGSRALFLETVRRSNAACQNGDYALAASLYTEALGLDPLSHVLYSNRSAARLKMGLFALALQDAVRATELSPQWPKVYILSCLFFYLVFNCRFMKVTLLLGVLSSRCSIAMLGTPWGGSRCLQHGISPRCIQSSIIIWFSGSILKVSITTDLGADVPTATRHETGRVSVCRHLCGRSRATWGWTIQSGCWRVGSCAHYRVVQLKIERLRVFRSVQCVLGIELFGQSDKLHAARFR